MEFQETLGRQVFTFGTWNVQGLSEKKMETFAEIERENEDLVVLTETKLRGTGYEDYGHYTHIFNGVKTGPARAGVSIFIRKELGQILKWHAVSERIITAKLGILGQKVVIIGVYWVDDNAKPSVKDKFQENLKNTIQNVKKEHELIVLGDFNSKVGQSTTSKIVGNHGDKEINNNGRRLVNLCEECNLKIQNTFFNHDDLHKYTWYHKRNSSKSLIDYCITRQCSSLCVLDVLACRWLECGTDHIFLEATISFPIIKNEENIQTRTEEDIFEHRKYKTFMLFSKTVRSAYKDYLDSIIDLSDNRSTEEMYQHLKKSIHLAAHSILGFQDKTVFGEFLWDKEIKELRAKRLQLIEQSENTEQVAFDTSFDDIKNEVWTGICATIDNANRCKKSKLARDILDELLNKTNENEFKHELSEEFFKSIFKESKLEVTNFHINKNKCEKNRYDMFPYVHVDVTDVTKALDELEDYKWPIPGALSIQLLRCSSHKTKVCLTNLIQDILNGKEIPREINETYAPVILKIKNNDKYITGNRMHVHSIMRVIGVILRNIIEKTIPFKNTCKIIPQRTHLETTFMLRLLLQKSAEKQNACLHLAFLNLANSYFDVSFNDLFRVLENYGICKKLLAIVEHLYKQNSIRIATPTKLSEPFILSKGLIKECSLAPTLFKMYIQKSIEEWNIENLQNGVTIENHLLSYIFFNDTLIIIANNKKNLETMVLSLKKHFRNINLHVSRKNINFLGNEELTLGRYKFTGENTINFEGSILELYGKNVEDVYNRILETKRVIGLLHPVARDGSVSKKNKRKIFCLIIRCILTNACETWTLTEDLKVALKGVEMSYWKWCCENYPVRYTSEALREMMGIKYDIFNVMMLRKTAWYTKVKHLTSDKWPKCILDWDPKGNRKLGKPRKKWVDGLEDFLKDLSHYQSYLQKNTFLPNGTAAEIKNENPALE